MQPDRMGLSKKIFSVFLVFFFFFQPQECFSDDYSIKTRRRFFKRKLIRCSWDLFQTIQSIKCNEIKKRERNTFISNYKEQTNYTPSTTKKSLLLWLHYIRAERTMCKSLCLLTVKIALTAQLSLTSYSPPVHGSQQRGCGRLCWWWTARLFSHLASISGWKALSRSAQMETASDT